MNFFKQPNTPQDPLIGKASKFYNNLKEEAKWSYYAEENNFITEMRNQQQPSSTPPRLSY